MPPEEYHRKRDFQKTPEPPGGPQEPGTAKPLFVIQKHAASHLHYDLRLESAGVLKSWAVPKGLSMNPEEKRLAVLVEDHPLDYGDFEGVIPPGNYGAGTVMIWDRGTYEAANRDEDLHTLVERGIEKGHFSVFLHGRKIQGGFTLFHPSSIGEKNWLIVKRDDKFSHSEVGNDDRSAVTGRTFAEIESAAAAPDLSGEAPKRKLPHPLKPMTATLADGPFSDPDWLFEIKWDGYRGIAEIDAGAVNLYSRNLISLTERFSPIADTLRTLPQRMVLDGEIVVVDRDGKSHFQLLQDYQRTGQGNLVYYVFDLLYVDQYDLTGLPLVRRKEILAQVLPALPNVKVSEYIEGAGEQFFAAAKEQDLEGIVGKRKASLYRPGTRSTEWLKIRNRLATEAVIVGYTAPKGSRQSFGSLLLGAYKDGRLTYIGRVGTGFSDQDLKEIGAELQPDTLPSGPPTPDFPQAKEAHWVEPRLVADVEFNGWTKAGLLRQPVWLGLREDKSPPEVVVETAKKFPRPGGDTLEAEGRTVTVTNPNKVFWPDEGYTKKDLLDYYKKVAWLLVPYLKDRPLTLHRAPDGIAGEKFYQKDVSGLSLPPWVETATIRSVSQDKERIYMLCQNAASLLYLANLGCIEMHPWNSTLRRPRNPDYLVLDLDPHRAPFSDVVTTTLTFQVLFDELKIDGYPKTSGAAGMHIYIPLAAKYEYDQVRRFAQALSLTVNRQLPQITSLERSPAKRVGKVYLDCLQNGRGRTMAAPYSVRSEPGATVSAPLKWSEVKVGLSPSEFNIRTILKRLDRHGDLFSGVLGPGVDIEKYGPL